MSPQFFRSLSAEEEATFRKAARETYEEGKPLDEAWHPVYQEECAKMNVEAWRKQHGANHPRIG